MTTWTSTCVMLLFTWSFVKWSINCVEKIILILSAYYYHYICNICTCSTRWYFLLSHDPITSRPGTVMQNFLARVMNCTWKLQRVTPVLNYLHQVIQRSLYKVIVYWHKVLPRSSTWYFEQLDVLCHSTSSQSAASFPNENVALELIDVGITQL